jgi:hypothetical protein
VSANTLGANDKHGRSGVHVSGGVAAKTDDERPSLPSTERAQFSGEDNHLAGKRRPCTICRAGIGTVE